MNDTQQHSKNLSLVFRACSLESCSNTSTTSFGLFCQGILNLLLKFINAYPIECSESWIVGFSWIGYLFPLSFLNFFTVAVGAMLLLIAQRRCSSCFRRGSNFAFLWPVALIWQFVWSCWLLPKSLVRIFVPGQDCGLMIWFQYVIRLFEREYDKCWSSLDLFC